jgi:DNA polymerase-3 subunit gamma/tau
MTYMALARKWRPKTFAELTGQGHVVTALSNALARGRLHHAYLLTGTRGVGKTTIARILAKSLNCATGVTATPCGACDACVDIDAGRFVDLLELDAASNTGVENMREILDNARYAPTVGRTKVYLIDEVHMLSKNAFNSMLKTLEEPPEHVKFILATTDPQKVPVTVLSRCLQFALKPLAPDEIAGRIDTILAAESIASDPAAIALIARAAAGSLRDGLSLLDQAIAYGGGEVREAQVRAMLGIVDRAFAGRVLDALAANDGRALLDEAAELARRGQAAEDALADLASLLHRVAVAQVVPSAADDGLEDAGRVAGWAAAFPAESVQLLWQIAVQGRADLVLAPDPSSGLAMTLIRMLAFEPAPGAEGANGSVPGPAARAARPSVPVTATMPGPVARPAAEPPTAALSPATASPPAATGQPATVTATSPVTAEAPPRALLSLPADAADWPGFVAALKLNGMAGELAAQTVLRKLEGAALTLALPASHKHLAGKAYADRLRSALEQATGRKLLLAFEVGEAVDDSLAARTARERAQARSETEAAFRDEPFVRDLVARFEGAVRPDTIKPR